MRGACVYNWPALWRPAGQKSSVPYQCGQSTRLFLGVKCIDYLINFSQNTLLDFNLSILKLWIFECGTPPPLYEFFQKDEIICPYKYFQLDKSDRMQLVACPELQFLAELKRAMYNIQCNAMWAETNMQCALSTWLEPLVEQIEQKKCAMCTGLIHKIICKLIQIE